MTKKFLPLKAAADELDITRRTMREIIDRGEVRAHRFGRAIKIERGVLDRYVERSVMRPTYTHGGYPV